MLTDDPNEAGFLSGDYYTDNESLFAKFEVFLNRASTCHNLFYAPVLKATESTSQSSQSSVLATKRQVILLEDLPNILHPTTQSQFHSALQSFVTLPVSNPPVPLIVIISDAGVRGEITDERMASGGGWVKARDGIVDIRTVFPRELLGGPFVTQIRYCIPNSIVRVLAENCFAVLIQLRRLCSQKRSKTWWMSIFQNLRTRHQQEKFLTLS